jgi:2,3-bisphosphoglycerate-dependent phosphoglycerate mutase
MTTTVYLVRHAHAEWSEDDARPLSRAGLDAAPLLTDRLLPNPIVAVYSSPSRRSVETVTPLASRRGLVLELVEDLRERRLPPVAAVDFDRAVLEAWRRPERAVPGGESNVQAQARGLAALRVILDRHPGRQVAVGTHGNLLALMLNGLDSSFGYDLWRRMSFPDVYRVAFDDGQLGRVDRLWDDGAP